MDNKEREKIVEKMKALREKRVSEMQEIYDEQGIEVQGASIRDNFTIKYLGKMEFLNEKGEMIEKDIFMTIEEIDGQFQIRYYDEEENLLGIQRAIDEDIILASNLSSKSLEEQRSILNKLTEIDKEQAKTVEELEREQIKEESEIQLKKSDGPQLTKEQVNSLKGPKVELNHNLGLGETLGNVIGLEGKYIQLISTEEAKKFIPDLNVPTSQRVVPIEIFSNGANVIGKDKLQYSAIEGANSAQNHVTMTQDGEVNYEQNVETFNIVSKGGMHTIAIGYDESGGTPLELKYGVRDIDDPTKIVYSELELVHEGRIDLEDKAEAYLKDSSEGIYKADKKLEEVTLKIATALNLKEIGQEGYPTKNYDLELARKILEEEWANYPDASLDELCEILIDENQKQPGPQDGRRG